jgi:hypothetical protein
VCGLLAAADVIERVLRTVANRPGWLMVVVCFDVLSRKLGFQIAGMGPARLHKLQWHPHTVLFAMWLGQCCILNAHPASTCRGSPPWWR